MSENEKFTDLANMVKENQKPQIINIKRGTDSDASVILVPDNMEVKSLKPFLEDLREKPARRTGNVATTRSGSFIDIVNRFKNKSSALFATAEIKDNSLTAKIKAIFDYNPENDDVKDAENLGHSATYNFPISNQFKIWLENNKKSMSQADFALFLEDHITEMVVAGDEERELISGLTPKFAYPLEILALSRDLEIYSAGRIKQKVKLSSGETEIQFVEEHQDQAGQPVKIPDFFVISMQLFEGATPERIIVRLRYRMAGQSANWFYDMYRIDKALELSFDATCELIKEKTGLPLFFGTAEK